MRRSNLIPMIVTALAAAEGTNPSDIPYNLLDYVDPEVLDHLDESTRGSWEYTFQVPGHDVTLTDDETVYVDGRKYAGRQGNADCTQSPLDGPSAIGQRIQFGQRDFRTVCDTLPGMVYWCRNERGWPMDFLSEGTRQVTGYDPGAFIVGGVSYGLDVIHPDDRPTVWETVQQSVEADEAFSIRYRIRTACGVEKQVWEKGAGIIEDGDVVGLAGFITDRSTVPEASSSPQPIPAHEPQIDL